MAVVGDEHARCGVLAPLGEPYGPERVAGEPLSA